MGKSTLLRGVAADLDIAVIDLDDLDVRANVKSDPAWYVGGVGPRILDEFQHVPEILDAIKAELNRSSEPGRYLLAGSTRYATLPRTAQSLTGRATVVPVMPFSQGEIDGRVETFMEDLLDNPMTAARRREPTFDRNELVGRVLAGGFPPALMRTGTQRRRWFADYLSLVLERDVLEISKIRQRASLPRLLRRLAAQTGQILNMAEAARTVRIEPSVAESYTKLLETVFLLQRLPAWGTTLGSRIGGAPKVHVVDSGIAAHLLRVTPEKLDQRTPQAMTEFGFLMETFVVAEILKQVSWLDEPVETGHWRTRGGVEVDLVIERPDGGVVGIEIKARGHVRDEDASGLRSLAKRLGDSWRGGVVLYAGSHSRVLDADLRIAACSVNALWA